MDSLLYRYTVNMVIVLNFMICASLHYTFNDGVGTLQWIDLITITSFIFTVLYSLEIILKLMAGGFRYFWSFKSNRFCCIIVLCSWIAIALFCCIDGVDVVYPVTALMILRIVVIAPYFEPFWQILKWAQSSLVHLTVITLLVLYTFALFGKYLFVHDGDAVSRLFGDHSFSFWDSTDLFESIAGSMLFLSIYVFNSGNVWTPPLIQWVDAVASEWKVIVFLWTVYVVMMVLYSVYFAIYLDVHNDWKKVQSISRHLCILEALGTRWKLQVMKWRGICIEHQKGGRALVEWKELVDGTNLFMTSLCAFDLLNILAHLPPPIGFGMMTDFNVDDVDSHNIQKVSALLADLKIPIRRQQRDYSHSMDAINGAGGGQNSDSVGGDEWEYVVNFSDVIHAFTWKLLKVEVTVNLEPDEQFIAEWFAEYCGEKQHEE